jgi:hypothetical protein
MPPPRPPELDLPPKLRPPPDLLPPLDLPPRPPMPPPLPISILLKGGGSAAGPYRTVKSMFYITFIVYPEQRHLLFHLQIPLNPEHVKKMNLPAPRGIVVLQWITQGCQSPGTAKKSKKEEKNRVLYRNLFDFFSLIDRVSGLPFEVKNPFKTW